ncbi:MAG: hypothetical protein ACOYT8_06320 [Candidatus Dependentiae bacterium]
MILQFFIMICVFIPLYAHEGLKRKREEQAWSSVKRVCVSNGLINRQISIDQHIAQVRAYKTKNKLLSNEIINQFIANTSHQAANLPIDHAQLLVSLEPIISQQEEDVLRKFEKKIEKFIDQKKYLKQGYRFASRIKYFFDTKKHKTKIDHSIDLVDKMVSELVKKLADVKDFDSNSESMLLNALYYLAQETDIFSIKIDNSENILAYSASKENIFLTRALLKVNADLKALPNMPITILSDGEIDQIKNRSNNTAIKDALSFYYQTDAYFIARYHNNGFKIDKLLFRQKKK